MHGGSGHDFVQRLVGTERISHVSAVVKIEGVVGIRQVIVPGMGERQKRRVAVRLPLPLEVGEVDDVFGVVAFADNPLLAGGQGEVAGAR